MSSATITITLLDAAGGPVPGLIPLVAVTGSGNTLKQPAASNAAGVSTATLTSTVAEAVTISVTIGGAGLPQHPTVQFVAGIATTMVFSRQPADVAAGAAFQAPVQVTFMDASGHPATQGAVAVTLVLGGAPHGGTLSGNTSVSPVGGVAVFPGLSIQQAGEGYTLSATASGFFPVSSAPFNVTADAAAQLAFTVQPSNVVAGALLAPAVQVTIEDPFGNPVPTALESVTLQIGHGPTGAVLGGTLTAAPVNGIATFPNVEIDRAGVGYTLSASASALAGATSGAFNVTAGAASQLAFVVPPSNVQAGAVMTPAVEVAAQDSLGNTVSSATAAITVALSGCPSGPGLAGTTTVAAADGVATFAGLAVDTAGTCMLVASDGTDAPATSPPFQVTSGPPAKLVFVVQPANTVAAVAIAPPVQVALRDAFGNVIPSTTPVTLTLSTAGGPGVIAGTSQADAAAGVATFSNLVIDTAGLGDALIATAAGYAGATSSTFDITTGAPSMLDSTVVANPDQVTADGTSTITLTVTVEDAGGNRLSGQTVTLGVSGTGNTLLPASGTSATDGTFTATLSSTASGVKTVTATVGAAVVTTTVTFEAGALAPANSSIVVSPLSVTADGSSTATVTVVAEDQEGNPIAGRSVTMSTDGSANVFTPAGGPLDTAGSFTATVSSTKAQTENVIATIGGIHLSTSLTFAPGPPSASRSTISASPAQVLADGTSTTTLTVTARDAQGNAVGGQTVGFGATGGNNIFSAQSVMAAGTGVATATLASTKAEVKTVTATLGATMISTAVTFFAGAPVASKSSMSIAPASVTADGQTTAGITVALEDTNGNPASGQFVSLGGSGTANTFSPQDGSTGSDGVFLSTVASPLAQSETITATAGALVLTAPVTFAPGLPSTATSTFVVSPNGATADGVSTDTLTVTVEDPTGNLISGQTVSLATTGAASAFSPASGQTGANGVFLATVTSIVALSETVTATIGSVVIPATVTFVAGAPSQEASTLAANPATTYSDGISTSTLTLTVEDILGNPVDGQQVSLGSGTVGDQLSATSGTTSAAGTFTATLTSTVTGVHTITATVGAFTLQTTVTFVSQFNLGAGGALTTTQPSVASTSGLQVFGGLEYTPQVCTSNSQFCISGGVTP